MPATLSLSLSLMSLPGLKKKSSSHCLFSSDDHDVRVPRHTVHCTRVAVFAANISSLSSTFSAGFVPPQKRAKKRLLYFIVLYHGAFPQTYLLFLFVVISLDMKYAFHYEKTKQKQKRFKKAKQLIFGAARSYRSKT